jgi:hypothetical protein
MFDNYYKYKIMVKKKKESKASSQKPKSRAKYQCPAKLEDLIYQVNLVPIDFDLQSIQFLTERGLTKTDAVKHCLEYAPQELREHIEFMSGYDKITPETDEHTRNFYLRKMADEYFEYYEMRESMNYLVNRLKIEREYPNDFFDWIGCPLPLRTLVYRDVSGKLQSTGLGTLVGNFDDTRLRRCKNCKRVFWAKRKESETCSLPCLNAFNVRRYRSLSDEEKAERKAQREANKLRNKRLKEIRSKK